MANSNHNFNNFNAPQQGLISQPQQFMQAPPQSQTPQPAPQDDLLNLFSSHSPQQNFNSYSQPTQQQSFGNPQNQFNNQNQNQFSNQNQNQFSNQNQNQFYNQNPQNYNNNQFNQQNQTDDRSALLNMLKAEPQASTKRDIHAQFGISPSGRPMNNNQYNNNMFVSNPQQTRTNVFRGGSNVPRRSASNDPFGNISPF